MVTRRAHIVDPDIADYVARHSTRADAVQQRLINTTAARTGTAARMQIGVDQGTFHGGRRREHGSTHRSGPATTCS